MLLVLLLFAAALVAVVVVALVVFVVVAVATAFPPVRKTSARGSKLARCNIGKRRTIAP